MWHSYTRVSDAWGEPEATLRVPTLTRVNIPTAKGQQEPALQGLREQLARLGLVLREQLVLLELGSGGLQALASGGSPPRPLQGPASEGLSPHQRQVALPQ